MKKIVWLILAILALVASILIGFKIKIDKEITTKIEEFNNNGFAVKHNESTNYLKTKGNGEIEVIYPDKVATYIFKNMENQELKKALEKQYNLLEITEKEMLFEGVKFEYDFEVDNLKAKLNSNIYLTTLSKKIMYNLSQETQDQTSRWLLDFLKDKKLNVNIKEDGQYKVSDIDTVIPDEAFITIRGLEGNGKNLKLPLIKVSNTDTTQKGFLQLNNLNIDFDKTQNKENSKSTIETIQVQDFENILNIKNLVINSNYEKDEININAKSEISFDEVTLKNNEEEDMNFAKSSLNFNVNNLPIKKLEEIKEYLENQRYDEYLKSIAQSGIVIKSNGSASNYLVKTQKIFDTLKYDLLLEFNKSLSIDEIKSIKDIFEKIKLVVDLDKQTALNAKTLLSLQSNSDIDFVDTQDNLRRFEAELRTDGIYVNNKKVLDEKELIFPEEENFDEPAVENTTSKGVFYEYKLLDDNLLQVDFKYVADMNVVSSGGISVSFPQLKDATRIKEHKTNSFEKINYYNANSEIWNGGLQKNIKSTYLLIEGWDENWKDVQTNKEFSLIIDVKDLDVLQINLRAGALNESDSTQKASEIVPIEGELDQQNYPIEIADIEISTLKK